MAKKTSVGIGQRVEAPPVKRKGVHAKRGSSQLPQSKNYKKPYRGQGR